MSKQSKSPIFYDPTEHRWYYYKRGVALVSVILSVAFLAALFSIAQKENFPALSLTSPAPVYHNRPVVSQQNTNLQTPVKSTPKNTNAIQGQGGKFPPKPVSPQNASPAGYKPKLIGFYVDWDDTSFTSLKSNYADLDELVPEWLHLSDKDGSIVIDDQNRQNETLDFLAKNRSNLPIVPLINNYDSKLQNWNGDRLKRMLANPDARTRNVDNILNFVQNNKFAGVSIDYESIPPESQGNFIAFMIELYGKFHPLGLEVQVNVPLEDPTFDVKALADSSDFLILMAYDENSPGDQAGPVASQNWFVSAMDKRFAELPSDKYIVALGNYGYDWKKGKISAATYTFQDAVRVAKESQGVITLDSNSLNETYGYYDDKNDQHTVFFLDAVSAFNEIGSINKYKLGGYALWRLGSEDPSIWKVFKARQDLNRDVSAQLQLLNYGYDVDYEGEGEILKVTQTPKEGHRTLEFDDKQGLITKAEIQDFPSPYVITRWGASDKKKIALTFDDGPDPVYTPQILKIFDQYKVKGTFFIIGVNATQNQKIIKQIVSAGHEIGSHTFTHPNISTESDSEIKFELNSVESLLASTIGRHTLMFRPPYAEDIEPETPDQVKPLVLVDQLGYYTVSMHIDPTDWNKPGVDNIVNSVISSAEAGDGNIVLLHDGGGDRSQTIVALPRIIEGLQSKGYQMVTVSDLIGVSQDAIMPKVTGSELVVSDVSRIAFVFTNWAFYLLSIAFTVGIFLGVARFLFIAVLAVEQKIRSRHAGYLTLEEYHPRVSVLIPAYNEEKVILRTIKSILKSDYPYYDIIVIDDGSQDATYEKVHNEFNNNTKVRIYTKPNGGKSNALNFGIEKTKAEIVVTLDADTIFRPDTISKLARHFDNPKVGAVAGNAKVGNRINLLTYWQALEYITSQNLDRRAFHLMNCITVVPGSVGAWRREAMIKAGGFSDRTLAEDADLTFFIIRLGYKVNYDEEAIGYTEAPDTVKGFIKQRFRWMYGTLQTAWKHKEAVNCPGCRALGFFAIPNIFVFQVIFPLISPFMDLTILTSLVWVFWQKYHHPLDYSATFAFKKLFYFYLFFLLVDFITSAIAFVLERKEDWSLLFWMFLQRFFYRQLMYYVAIKVTAAVIKGRMVRWGNLERKATVK